MPFIITKPLDEQKQEFIAEVNALAGAKILALYPDYKQRNMTARYVELVTLGELDTQEALSIKSAWEWIKSVRERSNVANLGIQSASTIAEIKPIVDQFKTDLSNL